MKLLPRCFSVSEKTRDSSFSDCVSENITEVLPFSKDENTNSQKHCRPTFLLSPGLGRYGNQRLRNESRQTSVQHMTTLRCLTFIKATNWTARLNGSKSKPVAGRIYDTDTTVLFCNSCITLLQLLFFNVQLHEESAS